MSNRGARGWQPPTEIRNGSEKPVRIYTEDGFERTLNPGETVTLVEYRGVWMTKEDAERCRTTI